MTPSLRILSGICLSAAYLAQPGSTVSARPVFREDGDGLLKQPPVFQGKRKKGKSFEVDLSIAKGKHTTKAATTLTTRMLGGSIPGPTIRVRKGDTLVVNFTNDLKAQAGTNTAFNEFSFPDESNLHFHGAHVSGERPGGDTTLSIGPGGFFQYRVAFPEDHAPGIFWVHPHRHGSGTLQVGGGAALALIVEDEPGDVPKYVETAEEVILMVQLFDKAEFDEKVLPDSGDKLFNLVLADGVEPDFRLLNGQYKPTLKIELGTWQRWRVIFGSWDKKPLDLVLDGCETYLLAKDGIYTNDDYRMVSKFPIPTGGRADIMVKCSTKGTFSVNDYGGELFTLHVIDRKASTEPGGPPESHDFPRPRYLRNLLTNEPTEGCSCDTFMDDDKMNGLSFDPEIYLHTIGRGSIVERIVEGVESHPYHQHVYPFQLQEFYGDIDAEDSAYFKVGDYVDSLSVRSSDKVRIKYEARDFPGRMAVHCHRITHSDVGMLAAEDVINGGSCQCSPKEAAEGFTRAPTATPVKRPKKRPKIGRPKIGRPKIGRPKIGRPKKVRPDKGRPKKVSKVFKMN